MDTQIQLNELKHAMKQTKDRRLFERYQAVYLYLDGHTMNEVAQIIGRTRKTVSSYVSSYRTRPRRPSPAPFQWKSKTADLWCPTTNKGSTLVQKATSFIFILL